MKEAHLVLKEMAQNGLKQHKNGLLVYGMCEIPSNVILVSSIYNYMDICIYKEVLICKEIYLLSELGNLVHQV